jgi:hypothetical protein
VCRQAYWRLHQPFRTGAPFFFTNLHAGDFQDTVCRDSSYTWFSYCLLYIHHLGFHGNKYFLPPRIIGDAKIHL